MMVAVFQFFRISNDLDGIIKGLGSGAFSRVYECYDNETNELVALKAFRSETQQTAKREIAYLRFLNEGQER